MTQNDILELDKQDEATLEKVREHRKKLQARERKLLNGMKERASKARSSRIFARGEHIENLYPITAEFSNEIFNEFIEKTLETKYAQDFLTDAQKKSHAITLQNDTETHGDTA